MIVFVSVLVLVVVFSIVIVIVLVVVVLSQVWWRAAGGRGKWEVSGFQAVTVTQWTPR